MKESGRIFFFFAALRLLTNDSPYGVYQTQNTANNGMCSNKTKITESKILPYGETP